MNDDQLTHWRDECRKLDAEIEQRLWKLGEIMADGVQSFGKPAKEFSKTFKTPPSITDTAVAVHKSLQNFDHEERISFAIARELTSIKSDQERFQFYDEAVTASQKHLDPVEFRKMLRGKLSTGCHSPNKPRSQPVKLIRQLINFFKDQPASFWSREMCLAWIKELKPIVDWFQVLNAKLDSQPSERRNKAC